MHQSKKNTVTWTTDRKCQYGSLPTAVAPPSATEYHDMDCHDEKGERAALIVWERSALWIRRRIWRNVILVGVGSLLFYSGMNPMTVLQSSLNSEDGLGVVSLAIKSAFMILGSLLASAILHRFGCKRTLVVGGFFYASYVAANFYPTWYTMVPASCVSGAAATIFLTAQKVYLAKLAHHYASVTDIDVDRIQSRLFVLMTVCVKLSSTIGYFVSSVILGTQDYDQFMASARLLICGAHYCNEDLESGYDATGNGVTNSGYGASGNGDEGATNATDNLRHLYAPGQLQVYILCGACLTACLIGVFVLFLLDPLTHLGLSEKPKHVKPVGVQLMETLRQMKDLKHIMLIPMAMILTGGDSFWAADFSKAFITCAIGIQFIGYVSIWNGIGGAVSSLLFGWFNKKRIRCFPFVISTLLQMSVLMVMFYWRPSSDSYIQMSMFATLWFFGSGIRHVVLPALYAVLFSNNLEAAFSVYHIWSFLASTLVYAWSNLLCMTAKMYILLGLLAASFLGYLGAEIVTRRGKSIISPPMATVNTDITS